jgi:cell division protein FtsN
VWFGVGVLLGAFGLGLAWLELGPGRSGAQLTIPGLQQPTPTPSPAQQRDPAPGSAKPRFDFYTMLPEMEVAVPKEEPAAAAPPPPPPSRPAPAEEGSAERESYVLQIGSFRRHADADRLKARLALMGIEAAIQKVTINNKDTYHRVRSGPYSSRSALDRVRTQLRREGIESIAIKLKG